MRAYRLKTLPGGADAEKASLWMVNLERKLDERLVRVNPISPFSEHGPPHRNGLSDPALPRPRITGPIGHDGHGHGPRRRQPNPMGIPQPAGRHAHPGEQRRTRGVRRAARSASRSIAHSLAGQLADLAANFARPRNGEPGLSHPGRQRQFDVTVCPRAAAIS